MEFKTFSQTYHWYQIIVAQDTISTLLSGKGKYHFVLYIDNQSEIEAS